MKKKNQAIVKGPMREEKTYPGICFETQTHWAERIWRLFANPFTYLFTGKIKY